jgi:antitoxin VapB
MPLYIKDETVNQLAVLVMETIGAESKTEAVRKALIAQLNAVKQKRLLLESVRDLQDKVDLIGPIDPDFDQKTISNEMHKT